MLVLDRYAQVFSQRNLMLGVLGIFFYVAEVSIGSFLVNSFQEPGMVPLIRESNTLSIFVAGLLPLVLGAIDNCHLKSVRLGMPNLLLVCSKVRPSFCFTLNTC
ncbi:MAG: hypothetical protein GKR88_03975 [Flavobacteriaceae bacterium]|nr:MAG: hypothetical protein GKR88_03975 [Flavobacteriaceae bacterium]